MVNKGEVLEFRSSSTTGSIYRLRRLRRCRARRRRGRLGRPAGYWAPPATWRRNGPRATCSGSSTPTWSPIPTARPASIAPSPSQAWSPCSASYDDKPPEPNFGSQYKNLLHHYTHQKANEEASTFWSGRGAVSRQAFLGVGGFDPAKYHLPSIEDVELGYRLRESGGKVKIDRHFLSVHLKRWSVPELIRTDILRRAVPLVPADDGAERTDHDLNVSAPSASGPRWPPSS